MSSASELEFQVAGWDDREGKRVQSEQSCKHRCKLNQVIGDTDL